MGEDDGSAPAYTHTATHDTLTTISKNLLELQEQLRQLRLSQAGENRASTIATSSTQGIEQSNRMSSVIDRIEKLEQTLTELNAKSSAFTTRVETMKTDMMESRFLIQTRARINGIIGDLQNMNGTMRTGYDPETVDFVLAYNRRHNTKLSAQCMCDQLEMLLKEEAEEIKYLHRLRMDHQHQLDMACQSQGQGQDGVAAGLEQLAKATSQLAASIVSEKSLATIEAKPERLLSEHSATVSRTDNAAIPGPAVNKSPASLSSVSSQAPRMLEREGTSTYLIRLQGKIELVRELLYDLVINDRRPCIKQLSEKAIGDPEILMLWSQSSGMPQRYRSNLTEFLETLLEKEEAEWKYLRGLAVAGRQ